MRKSYSGSHFGVSCSLAGGLCLECRSGRRADLCRSAPHGSTLHRRPTPHSPWGAMRAARRDSSGFTTTFTCAPSCSATAPAKQPCWRGSWSVCPRTFGKSFRNGLPKSWASRRIILFSRRSTTTARLRSRGCSEESSRSARHRRQPCRQTAFTRDHCLHHQSGE